ncbi:hypothetical protein ScPMuIL_013964 [Solemya velum]
MRRIVYGVFMVCTIALCYFADHLNMTGYRECLRLWSKYSYEECGWNRSDKAWFEVGLREYGISPGFQWVFDLAFLLRFYWIIRLFYRICRGFFRYVEDSKEMGDA